MSQIKYGEIFIIHNLENILTNLYFFIGYDELYVSEESTIIIQFDDEEIHNTNDKLCDVRFRYNHDNTHLPSSFKTYNNTRYFKKECKIIDDKPSLNFNSLFHQFKKYDTNNNISSYFNGIYFRPQSINNKMSKIDKFGIVRVKSSSSSPMYHFAYDSSEFSKDQLINIINSMFRKKNTTLL